jgi:hypothetical protein
MPDATYYTTTDSTGKELLHCLYCARAGQEHHAADPELFTNHMAQRHDGRMVEGPKPEEPAPAPAEEEGEDVPDPAQPQEPSPDSTPEPVPGAPHAPTEGV